MTFKHPKHAGEVRLRPQSWPDPGLPPPSAAPVLPATRPALLDEAPQSERGFWSNTLPPQSELTEAQLLAEMERTWRLCTMYGGLVQQPQYVCSPEFEPDFRALEARVMAWMQQEPPRCACGCYSGGCDRPGGCLCNVQECTNCLSR